MLGAGQGGLPPSPRCKLLHKRSSSLCGAGFVVQPCHLPAPVPAFCILTLTVGSDSGFCGVLCLPAVLQQLQPPCSSSAEGHVHKHVPSSPEPRLLLRQVVVLEDMLIFYKVETVWPLVSFA